MKQEEREPVCYPEGLKVKLGPDQIKKLGLKEVLKVGRSLVFCVEAEVKSLEKLDYYEDKECDFFACLQITFMEHLNTKEGDEEDEEDYSKPPIKKVKAQDIYG